MASFTEEQVEYLRSLPAVSRVSSSRISYARWFRDECLARYAAGEHPVDLFRRAGMGPELIGYKRIERAFARWRRIGHVQSLPAGRPRSEARNSVTGSESVETATVRPDVPIGVNGPATAPSSVTKTGAEISSPASYVSMDSVSAGMRDDMRNTDMRDLLIGQQTRYIRYLESEIVRLRRLVYLRTR